MIKILIFILTFSSSVFAAAQLQIEFTSPVVKQGGLTDAIIRLDAAAVQQVEVQKLKGVSLADTIYLYQVSSLIRSGNSFEADAKIIFLKVPNTKPVVHKMGDKEISITWSDVEVQPTEAPAQFLFGQFEIPSRRKLLQWAITLLSLLILALGIFKLRQKSKKKKELKQRRNEIKDKVISAREYEEVVKVWEQKASTIKEFPHLEEPFKELETVLFKYQFKPHQTETEKAQIMQAYRDFVTKGLGGFNGV